MALNVLKGVPVPLVLLDQDLKILFSNPAFDQAFGQPAAAVAGRNFATLDIGAEAIVELRGFAKNSQAEDSPSRIFDVTVQESGEEPRVMLMEAHKVDTNSHTFVLTMIDVTDRLSAEARIRELQAEHSEMSKKAAMSELATTIAHELNQPLSAAINYNRACAQTLRSSNANIPKESYEMIEKAIDQVNRAAAIIRNLRDYIEQEDVEFAEEDLGQIVQEAVELARVSAPEMSADVRLDFASCLNPISVNRVQIQQVVMNLVRNSLEAMDRASKKTLTVSIRPRGDGFVEVAFSDTGSGVPDLIAENLFDPFVSDKDNGLGIGLTICRSIIERHGGEIWADKTGEQGATVCFTLPSPVESEMSQYDG